MNKNNIIRQVTKAIKSYPTKIYLKRIPLIDDGMNGYEEGKEIDVATFDAFIDEGKATLSEKLVESGESTKVKKITMITVANEDYEIKIGDYFTAKGKKFRVVYPNNLFDICYCCELEVIL